MKLYDLARYGLWFAVAETAYENRETYHMSTTWLPHLITNSLSLLFPEIVGAVLPLLKHAPDDSANDLELAEKILVAMVVDNPHYVSYVTPLAVGYMLSHPRFNIYKGELADIRVLGLGLDALPHAATAYGLAALTADTAEYAATVVHRRNVLYPLIRWAANNPALFSGLILAVVTLVWEGGEYRTHRYELAKQHGDISKINMMWSLDDTARDVTANALGWLAAMIVRLVRGRH